jgi:hypothetical protein
MKGAQSAAFSVSFAFGLLLLFFVARALVRNEWVAAVIVVLLIAVLDSADSTPFWIALVSSLLQYGTNVAILMRFGVLPLTAAVFISETLQMTPLTTDLSPWYSSAMYAGLAIVLAVVLWSFKTALGGRKLWTAEFLER